MKLSVSTYSFQAYINSGAMSQLQCIQKAKELGFGGVEIAELYPADPAADRMAYAREIKDLCQQLELPIVNYTIGADFINGSNGNLDAEIERVKGEVDIAALLGAPGMRHDAGWGFGGDSAKGRVFADALPRMAEGCRRVAEYAALKGVKTMVENHGTFCQDSLRVEALVGQVAHPNFGLLVDMGNFLCVDEAPQEAVGRLASYAFYVHAKDFHKKSGSGIAPGDGFFVTRGGNYLRGAIVGHGEVPVYQCLKVLKANGYDGYVGLEFEGLEDPILAISLGLNNLRRFLTQI